MPYITGRVYNAMMAFCGGRCPLMCCDGNGHIYATDTYVCMRWNFNEATIPQLHDGEFTLVDFNLAAKPSAAQKIEFIEAFKTCDLTYPKPDGLAKVCDCENAQTNNVTWQDLNFKYIEKITNLAKAIKTEMKMKDLTIRVDTGTIPSKWSIDYGGKGTIDIVTMPLKRAEYFAEAEED